jgi:hypothetical protein
MKIKAALCRALVSILSIVSGATLLNAASTRIITGPDTGLGPVINTYSFNGASTGSFTAENPSFTGGVRVALANVVTTADIITGTGPGSPPFVKVFSGPSRSLKYSFLAFPSNFTLGIYVAGGDINADGHADIVIGTGDGTGSSPIVRVISGADGSTVLHSFFAFNSSFTGGVRVAAGDVDGDGRADIIAGSGPGSSLVTVFSGQDLSLLKSFVAFPGFTGGVYVAAGDVNGDGRDDILVGAGSGSSAVKVFNAADDGLQHNFLAFPNSTGGVRVAATDLNGNGRADIIVASGTGDPARLRAFADGGLEGLIDIVPYPNSTAGIFPGAVPRYPAQSLNLSTRARVLTGDNVLIGGFIINGNDPKSVIVRGIGPSSGVPGALSDPTLELFSGNTLIASNNDWKTRPDGTSQQAEVEATSIPPANDLDSALVRTLAPGSYTAVLRGNAGETGIGLVEVYDLTPTIADSQLANISTRGVVETGDNVMIGGLILGGGTGVNTIVVRALGPSLNQFGITNTLSNPAVGIYNNNGTLLRFNDNWRQNQEADILATGLAPSDNLESALISLLGPGNYTAIVTGSDNSSGVGLVEIYNLQ